MLHVIHYWTDELTSLRSNKELNCNAMYVTLGYPANGDAVGLTVDFNSDAG